MKLLDTKGRFLFGKFKGVGVDRVSCEAPWYLKWCRENVDGFAEALSALTEPSAGGSGGKSRKGKKTPHKAPVARKKAKPAKKLSLHQRLMENIRESIQDVMSATDKDSKIQLPKLIKLIDYSLESEKDWDEFKMYFEKVHSSFFENMKQHFPDLSQSDLKLCALISLNLSMKEMAELMGISPESVKMARHRLRKKLDIASDENLVDFLANFKTA